MEKWYQMGADDALRRLDVDAATGLDTAEVGARREKFGKNAFEKQKKESLLRQILRQLKDISILILIFASALSLALAIREGHGFIEPIVIFSIVILNVFLAVFQERSAEKAMEALAELNSPHCIVIRDGGQREIDTTDLVPGDMLVLKTGSLVPADARLVRSSRMAVDESSLTGESEAVEKDPSCVFDSDIPIGDRLNMLYSGCLVTAGQGTAVVTATGMATELGKIAGFLNTDQKLKTPLQVRLDKVGKIISFIAIISAIGLFAMGTVQGEDFWNMMLLAVSLAVAAVPETMALIVTLSLSQGIKKMAAKSALIRKLQAVETLGSTSVICSDKTGTLTQNRMAVQRLWRYGDEPVADSAELTDSQRGFLEKLVLASTATVEQDDDGNTVILGDATESAILRLLLAKGIDRNALLARYPKVAEIPFSSARKMMTTVVQRPEGGYLVLTKGAFDRLPFERHDANYMAELERVHDAFAADALRVIALASAVVDELPPEKNLSNLEKDLRFDGIVGLIDPPRPEAAEAIVKAKRAGIRTVMITGDHASTAGAIARDLGIIAAREGIITGQELSELSDDDLVGSIEFYSVYARVSPEDKIRIVEAWQSRGAVVAMTGDGVNDAPALKAADVGVAMGKNGTDVAKGASDMVLTDDNFATIIDAVAEGRNVFSNIRKVMYFLIVCNISEIVVMLGAQLIGWGVPVTPIMLLLINVLGDGVPGIWLAWERSDPRIMDRRPIARDESFFGGGIMEVIIQQTIAFSVVAWAAYYIGAFKALPGSPGPSHGIGQTMAFLVLGYTSIIHVFTVRSRKSVFKRTVRDNMPILYSAIAMIVVFACLVTIPSLANLFGFTAIGPLHWLIIAGLCVVPTLVAEYEKFWDNRKLRTMEKNRVFQQPALAD